MSEENVINEVHERQRRANNLMFYNLPEQEQVNPHQTDLEVVNDITKEITNEDVIIVKVIRVGKPNKSGARPLKVIFKNSEDALNVLKRKRNMKKERKVYIDTDMTFLQMKNMRELKKEVQTRKDNGENVFIKFVRGAPIIVTNSKNPK